MGDLNADGVSDLLFNVIEDTRNAVHIGHSTLEDPDEPLSLTAALTPFRDRGEGFENHDGFFADIDGDGDTDAMWINHGQEDESEVDIQVSLIDGSDTPEWSWEHLGTQRDGSELLRRSTVALGSLNAGRELDLLWLVAALDSDRRLHTWVSFQEDDSNAGRFAPFVDSAVDASGWLGILGVDVRMSIALQHELANIDGDDDGTQELVVRYQIGTQQLIAVAEIDDEGGARLARLVQEHPLRRTDWNELLFFAGDVNGDGTDDLIWNNPASRNQILVATSH